MSYEEFWMAILGGLGGGIIWLMIVAVIWAIYEIIQRIVE